MDIESLTLEEIREIQGLFVGSTTPRNQSSTYPVGKNVIVRTVTMIFTGVLDSVTDTDLILTSCSWIPDTERYMDFVALGKVKECEPYPDTLPVFVNRGALLDMCELKSPLPRDQK